MHYRRSNRARYRAGRNLVCYRKYSRFGAGDYNNWSRLPRLSNNLSQRQLQIVPFRRWTDEFQFELTPKTSNAEVALTHDFILNRVLGSSEFTTLFDQYRITAVQCIYRPNPNVNDMSRTGHTPVRPELWICFDPDSNTDTGTAAIKQRGTAMWKDGLQIHKWWVHPKPLNAIQRTSDPSEGIATGGSNDGWIDMSNPNVVHYGCAIWIQIPASPADAVVPFTGSMLYRYFFECRGTR